MKLHYVELSVAIELEDDANVYDYVHESLENNLDITSFEIINVETKVI